MAELIGRLRQAQGRAKKAWSDRPRPVSAWLVCLGGFVAGAIAALVMGASREWAGGLIGLLGVVLGGVITWAANFRLERERRRSQVVMATWAERVRVHQEAFTWWYQIRDAAYEEDVGKRGHAVSEARKWCIRNCLYMTEEARDGFFRACTAAIQHRNLLDISPMNRDAASARNIETNLSRIDSLPLILIEGAGGHLSDDVLRELQREREHEAKKT